MRFIYSRSSLCFTPGNKILQLYTLTCGIFITCLILRGPKNGSFCHFWRSKIFVIGPFSGRPASLFHRYCTLKLLMCSRAWVLRAIARVESAQPILDRFTSRVVKVDEQPFRSFYCAIEWNLPVCTRDRTEIMEETLWHEILVMQILPLLGQEKHLIFSVL